MSWNRRLELTQILLIGMFYLFCPWSWKLTNFIKIDRNFATLPTSSWVGESGLADSLVAVSNPLIRFNTLLVYNTPVNSHTSIPWYNNIYSCGIHEFLYRTIEITIITTTIKTTTITSTKTVTTTRITLTMLIIYQYIISKLSPNPWGIESWAPG